MSDDPSDLARDSLDLAHEAHERAHRHGEDEVDPPGFSMKAVAILIAVLAAALALAEMGEKSAQNEYLTHHIAASDAWNFYQAKTIRAGLQRAEAALLDSLPNAADPEVRKKAEAAMAEAARLEDDEKTLGRKQLQAQARGLEEMRGHAFHEYHQFERASGGLQIAIVLASASVVTRMRVLFFAAAALGMGALLYAGAIALGLI